MIRTLALVLLCCAASPAQVCLQLRPGAAAPDVPGFTVRPIFEGTPRNPEAFARLGMDRMVLTDAGPEALALYRTYPSVERAWYSTPTRPIADVATSNDPWAYRQWTFRNRGYICFQYRPTAGADMNVYEAWGICKNSNKRIAIVDDGVPRFPDLRVNPVGYSAYGLNPFETGCAHGGHVASISGAIADNGIGMAGVAPGVEIGVYRALDSACYGTPDHWGMAVVAAVDAGYDIINSSLQFGFTTPAMTAAARYADECGVLQIAAAGNWAQNYVAYPARLEEVVAVGALDHNDLRASFSNYGVNLDISAPGVDVVGILPTSQGLMSPGCWSGTSMASPAVAGAAALVWQLHPNWTPAKVMKCLTESAHDLGDEGYDPVYGAGGLDVRAALERAAR